MLELLQLIILVLDFALQRLQFIEWLCLDSQVNAQLVNLMLQGIAFPPMRAVSRVKSGRS